MDIRAIFMGLSFAFIWSSAFSSARIIVANAPPLASLSLRFFISGILGVLLARLMGQTWQLTRDQWRATFIFGLPERAVSGAVFLRYANDRGLACLDHRFGYAADGRLCRLGVLP